MSHLRAAHVQVSQMPAQRGEVDTESHPNQEAVYNWYLLGEGASLLDWHDSGSVNHIPGQVCPQE